MSATKPTSAGTVGVRYMIDDVAAAVAFYTAHLGFALEQDAAPAFAAVSRDGVRLLLSGPTSSGRRPMPDGSRPVPGGWNRLHLQVADLAGEVARLRAAGVRFRNDVVTGPGGSQILLEGLPATSSSCSSPPAPPGKALAAGPDPGRRQPTATRRGAPGSQPAFQGVSRRALASGVEAAPKPARVISPQPLRLRSSVHQARARTTTMSWR
jgi:catechol 2,3-dioxygenase-like lactoylglutathione lyase family enzyme